jgi:hypothetical protein
MQSKPRKQFGRGSTSGRTTLAGWPFCSMITGNNIPATDHCLGQTARDRKGYDDVMSVVCAAGGVAGQQKSHVEGTGRTVGFRETTLTGTVDSEFRTAADAEPGIRADYNFATLARGRSIDVKAAL